MIHQRALLLATIAAGACNTSTLGADDAAISAKPADAASVDAASVDAMAADSGVADAMAADSGVADATAADSGVADATAADSGPAQRPWSLIVLPDTQGYASSYPAIFLEQTRWIAQVTADLNTKYVLHVGDVTNWNTTDEWLVAVEAFDELDGIVPYAVVPGNHDYYGDRTRDSRLSEFFPVDDFISQPTAGGLFEAGLLDNSYHVFEVYGETWIVLALEWGPRDAALAWANQVLDIVPADHAIVLVHAYLYLDDTRYDWATMGEAQQWNPHRYPASRWPEVNDGEEIWQKLITDRDNIRLVLCGHVGDEGVGRLTSFTRAGTEVHQLLANFQAGAMGGGGYLRILTFHADRLEVETYSPWLLHSYQGDDHSFTLPWPPSPVH